LKNPQLLKLFRAKEINMNVKLKMELYVNLEIRSGTRYYKKEHPVINTGVRNGTFYVDGNPSQVVSQTEINKIYMIKNGTYKAVDTDTFLAFYRNNKKSA
jgi:hypothetical protein